MIKLPDLQHQEAFLLVDIFFEHLKNIQLVLLSVRAQSRTIITSRLRSM
jgi:hypothetical protein